jgi:hypothetical protein
MKRFVLNGIVAFASAMAILSVTDATAALLYTTDFSTPTYTDGGLIGQDSWVITGTSVVNPLAVSDSATNGIVTLGSSGQDVRRAFAPSVAGDSVFMASAMTLASASATGDYFIHLGDDSTSNFYSRIYARTIGAGFQLAMGTSSGATGLVYGTELPFAPPFTLLARYDIIAGLANDTGALFINPTSPLGASDTPYVDALNVGTDATTISSVSLRQGGNTPFGTVSSITIDQISAVPEPTSMALIGMVGAAGLAARYRRKNASSTVAV